jgi:hypothetical protein
VRAYVSVVWGCPYEGDVPVARSLDIARRLLELGCYQVSVGDTIGVGTPLQTRDIVKAFLSEMNAPQLALHLHDTRGTALANALVGLEQGIRDFDASVAGHRSGSLDRGWSRRRGSRRAPAAGQSAPGRPARASPRVTCAAPPPRCAPRFRLT